MFIHRHIWVFTLGRMQGHPNDDTQNIDVIKDDIAEYPSDCRYGLNVILD